LDYLIIYQQLYAQLQLAEDVKKHSFKEAAACQKTIGNNKEGR
jgi:hypothetical protein